MVDTSYFGVCASPLQILIPPYSHTLLLCNNGNVLAMGSNQELQLGLPTPQNFSSNLLSFPAPVVAVAHGAGHSLVLLNDGRVMAWGGNNMGQLGNGTNTNSHIPVFVANICNAKAIAAGNRFSLALLSDGTVMGWGDNSSGQLGIAGGNSPLPINGLANIVQLDAGVQHSIFLNSSGQIFTLGSNFYNQQFNGTIPGTVVQIAAGTTHNLALTSNGFVYSWGYNNYGQLGYFTPQNSNGVPTLITGLTGVKQIEAGYNFSLFLTTNNELWACGSNVFGELGNCPTNQNTNNFIFNTGVSFPAGTHLFTPSVFSHTWAILASGGVEMWGYNNSFQLGTSIGNVVCNKIVPDEVVLCPLKPNSIPNGIPELSTTNYSICQGQSITICANVTNPVSGGTYYWYETGQTSPCITVNPTQTTTYTVQYQYPLGNPQNYAPCILSATATVTVNPLPNITITPQNPSICLGQSIVLTASGANNYVWTPNNTLNTNTGAVVTAMPTATTTYTVTGTNAFGCSGSAQTTVSVLPNPTTPVIQGVNNVCTTDPPQIVTYTISNCDPNLTYTWQFLPNGIATIVSNNNCSVNILWNVAMVNAGFGATINVTTSNAGCFSSSSLTVNPCCIPFDIDPNISAWHNNTSVLTTPFTIPIIGGTHTIINTSIAINGTFEIDADLIIDNCTVYFGPQAKINVQQGKMLWIKRNSILKAGCNEMWDGIYVSHPSSVVLIDDSRIQDAENAVYSNNGGNYIIQRNVFDLNHKHLVVNNAANHAGIVVSNQLLCAGTLITPRSGQRTHIAVEINDVLGINIGSAAQPMFLNTIDNADFGIFAKRSTFNVQNNKIENISDAPLLGLKKECPVGTGVCIVGNSAILLPNQPAQPVLTANIGGMAANELNNLKACEYGIMASLATHLNIYKNTLNFIAQTAVQVSSNSLRNVNILQNTIIDAYTGVHALNNRRCTLNINQNAIAQIDSNAVFLVNNSQGQIIVNNNTINNAARGAFAHNNVLSKVDVLNNKIQYSGFNTCGNTIYTVNGSCGEGVWASENPNSGAIYRINNNKITNHINGIVIYQLTKTEVHNNDIKMPVSNRPIRRGIEVNNCISTNVTYNKVSPFGAAITTTGIGGIYATVSPSSLICGNDLARIGYGIQCNAIMPSRVVFNTNNQTFRGIWLNNNGIISPQGSLQNHQNNRFIAMASSPAQKLYASNFTNGSISLFFVKQSGITAIASSESIATSGSFAIIPITTGGAGMNCPIPVSNIGTKKKIAQDSIVFPSPDERFIARFTLYQDIKTDTLAMADTVLTQFRTLESTSSIGLLDSIQKMMCDSACPVLLQNAYSLNASITTVLTPEALSKDLNTVVLERLIAGRDTFMQNELALLRSIAYECPFTHGVVVYEARALVTPYDPIGTMYYNVCETEENNNPANRIHSLDWEEEEQAVNQLSMSEKNRELSLFPNPNNGQMRIAYYLPQQKGEAQLIIYNALGVEIKNININDKEGVIEINEKQWESGVYFIRLMIEGEEQHSDKFVIIK